MPLYNSHNVTKVAHPFLDSFVDKVIMITIRFIVLLLFLAFISVPTIAIMPMIWLTPLWWVIAAHFIVGLFLLGRFATPAFIGRVASTHDLPAGAIREVVAEVITGSSFSLDRVRVVRNSCVVFFAGLGPSRTIFLGARVLSKGIAETRAVTAHVLGHYVHRHHLKDAILLLVYSLLTFKITDSMCFFVLGGADWPSQMSAQQLPLLLLIWAICLAFIEPFRRWVSRRQERQCRCYALLRTQNKGGNLAFHGPVDLEIDARHHGFDKTRLRGTTKWVDE